MLMLAMRKTSLLLVLAAIGGGAFASSANAANAWHTNGPRAFSSTNAGPSRMVIHASTGGITLVACTTSSLSGTLNGPTSSTLPWTNAGTVITAFSGCSVSGAPGYSVTCASRPFSANSYSGGSTLATAAGGHTTVTHTRHCTLSIGATTCSTISDTWTVTTVNPAPIATDKWKWTKRAIEVIHFILKIGAGCAAIPDGTTTFGAPGPGSTVTDLTYEIDGPNAPYMYYGT
jgi:hypothetical protein